MTDAFLRDGIRTQFGRYGGALAKVRALTFPDPPPVVRARLDA